MLAGKMKSPMKELRLALAAIAASIIATSLLAQTKPFDDPDAAFVEEKDGNAVTIAALVRKRYLVRTQADSDTVEARASDTRRRDKAHASGAQNVSTDYPRFEPAKWSGYFVALPDGLPARCNPAIAPPGCVDSELEPATR